MLVETVRDYAIFMLTPSGHVDSWNAGAERLKGYRADEIIGKHFSIFYSQAEVLSGKCEHELVVAAHEGRFEDEGWRIRRDGSRMWANVIITALRDETGRLVGFAKVTRDLSERKEAEEKLRTLAAEKATLAEKARLQEFHERFVAILGHDLRNPLATIDMGAGLLRGAGPGEDHGRVVERIASSARRMRRMIEQLLDLTRSRFHDGFEIQPSSIDLAMSLQDVVDELTTAKPQARLQLTTPPLPGFWDKDRMEQVFSNLVGNAIQYGAPGKPVSVRAWTEAASVLVDVHNQGPEIPRELQAKIFDAYRRGERDSRTPHTEGLGLGLHISHEIVRAHGGTIDVTSSEQQGTTFRVALPTVAGRRPSQGV